MEKEFVPYEQALALKELGFDEPCFAIWSGLDENNFSTTDTVRLFSSKFRINNTQSATFYTNDFNSLSRRVSAPTFSQAFRFFREKYKLYGLIEIGTQEFSYQVFNKKGNRQLGTEPMSYNGTYEEAELECLKKLIEIVKDGNCF